MTKTMFINVICATAMAMSLAACGHNPATRAVTGGLIGAGGGAAIGSATGVGAGTGALIGGGAGAVGGAATSPHGF